MNLSETKKNIEFVKEMTLGFLISENKVLLAMKKRGFGAGKWNGVGGKLDRGENSNAAMRREANEEIGVKIISFKDAGTLLFYNYDEEERKILLKVYLYTIDKWEGTPTESEEMRPEWFEIEKIPYDNMWIDDKYWLKLVLSGTVVNGEFLISTKNNKIVEYIINKKRQI